MTSEQRIFFEDYIAEKQLATISNGDIVAIGTPLRLAAEHEISPVSSPSFKKGKETPPTLPEIVTPEAAFTAIREGASWSDYANCKDSPEFQTKKAEVAVMICELCPVKKQCLDEGYRLDEKRSVRGGLFGMELRKKYRQLKADKIQEAKVRAEASEKLKANEAGNRDLQYRR